MKLPELTKLTSAGPCAARWLAVGLLIVLFAIPSQAFAACSGSTGIGNLGTDINGNGLSDFLAGDLPSTVNWTLQPAAGPGSLPIAVSQVRFALTCADNGDVVPCTNGNDAIPGTLPQPTPLQFGSITGGDCGASVFSNVGGIVTFQLPDALLDTDGCSIEFSTQLLDYGTDSGPDLITPAVAFNGQCAGGLEDGSAAGSDTIQILDPAIEVTKEGPDLAKAGDEITYTISFTVISDPEILGECTLNDPLLGGDLGVVVPDTPYPFNYTVPTDAIGPIENTATVTCGLIGGTASTIFDDDSATVPLIDPSISVTKSAPEIAKAGDEITYTIGFTNTGTGTLGVCTGNDPLLGGNLGVFTAGQTRDFTYTIPVDATGTVPNTATITCEVEGFQNVADGEASHEVNLIAPAISVTKSAPEIAKAGDEITYTIGFTNTGTGTLGVCTGNDPLLGGNLGVFTAGQTRDFTYTIPVDATGTVPNTATITCEVEGFQNVADGEASHEVNLIAPAISVTKSAPEIAKAGDEITYTIGFTNTGTGTLGVCTGNDPLLGGNLGVFTAGQTRDFTYTIPVDATGTVPNTATITCEVEGFQNVADGEASHEVELIGPAISVTKSAPEIAKAGDEITYTIGFTNTGTGTLGVCTGNDPLLGGNLGVFTAGQTRDFTYTIPVDATGTVPNTATITCEVEGFQNVADGEASHEVELIAPAISVTKSAPETAKAGDEITYTIGFTSTGTGTLGVCTGNDPLLGGNLGVFTAGQTRDFTYTIPVDATGTVPNTATITCEVEGFQNVADGEASHEVELIAPAVVLSKECSPDPVRVGETINWAITVTNDGNTELDCMVNDDTAPGITDVNVILPIGGTEVLNASREVVDGDGEVISNTATVDCDIVGFEGFDNVIDGEAMADCEVERGRLLCRTPGFWKVRAGEERGGMNYTGMVIASATPPGLEVCGEFMDAPEEAMQAMCGNMSDGSHRQLVRQLTAGMLNCRLGVCTTDLNTMLANCNAFCAGGVEAEFQGCIDEIDCFNNGGIWDGAMCIYGTGECAVTADACSDEVPCPLWGDAQTQECVADPTCHDDGNLCEEGAEFCFEPVGRTSSVKECKKLGRDGLWFPEDFPTPLP